MGARFEVGETYASVCYGSSERYRCARIKGERVQFVGEDCLGNPYRFTTGIERDAKGNEEATYRACGDWVTIRANWRVSA